ncbi:hypothetical protein Godav_018296 [Gossypium davidsonii]|uniref:Uncharacterized protein n=2 Tax=Gossypium TaxID=3633 RepID=A0A7J8QXB7_GOSDV|nr:hypothetical protein [Gossypium davidsonii]MBA0640700.1 hypothetical protein [Gossypium klotzschianum]
MDSFIIGDNSNTQRPLSCLCWRSRKEEICCSNIIPEASFIPEFVESS